MINRAREACPRSPRIQTGTFAVPPQPLRRILQGPFWHPLAAARRSLVALGRPRVALWRSCVALGLDLGWFSALIFKFFLKNVTPLLLTLVPSENAIYAIPWPPLGTPWALLGPLGAPWGAFGRPLGDLGCSWGAPGPPKGSKKAGPPSYGERPGAVLGATCAPKGSLESFNQLLEPLGRFRGRFSKDFGL